jgi:hypothetical protein
MSKFKIKKGASRITCIKLRVSIKGSIAVDLALMSEWSNNNRNYVVNELLRCSSPDAQLMASFPR